jgi:hypothetical protein
MGSSSPTPPTPQSPSTTANQQQQYNITAAGAGQAASNVNQVTPFGSLTYNQTGTGPGGIPLYTATSSLTPQLQQIVNTLGGQTSNLLTGANYGASNPADVVGNATAGNTKAVLGEQVAALQPYFTTQTQQLDTQLRNQGLNPSPSSNPSDPSTWGPYERAMNQLQQNQNQSVSGFLAQFEPQAYNQALTSYTLPATLAQSEYGMINPALAKTSFTPTPTTSVAPADYTSAVGQYQNMLEQQYAQQTGQQAAMTQGLFGIPTAVLGGWAQGGGLSSLGAGLGGLFGGAGAAGLGTAAGGTGAELAAAAPLLFA